MDKLAHSGPKSKAGDVLVMLRKLEVGLEPFNQTVAWAKEDGVPEWFEAASYYFKTYEDTWKAWITPKASEKVKEALDRAA